MSLYKYLFENSLELPSTDPNSDLETFQNGFENEKDYNAIENETKNVEMTPEEIQTIIKRGKIYKEKIDAFVLLLRKVQEEAVKGMYKGLNTKGLDKFAPLISDLTELGVALTAGIGDGLIKKQSDNQ